MSDTKWENNINQESLKKLIKLRYKVTESKIALLKTNNILNDALNYLTYVRYLFV